jgi:hypothetical protein
MCVATSTPHRQKIVKEVEVSWEAVSAWNSGGVI